MKLGFPIISYGILYVLINSIKYGIDLFCTKKYGPGGMENTREGARLGIRATI